MNNGGSDLEMAFFATGIKTYVEVDDAITEFRSLVQQKCKRIVCGRLDEINNACGMHWMVNDLKDYLQRTNDHYYIGKQAEVKGLGGLYFCLTLCRKDNKDYKEPYSASVFLYRQRRDLASGLWDRFASSSEISYSQGNIYFAQNFSEDGSKDFENYLEKAITDFLAFINDSGGLKKYLVPGSQQD